MRDEQLANFLEQEDYLKVKKSELIEKVFRKVTGNEVLKRKLYADYIEDMAVHPSRVEEMLDITKTERKRWTWKELTKKWFKIDGFLASAFQLAYWTMFVSRWAKEYQEKTYNTRKYDDKYNEKKELFYKLKTDAIKLLLQSPFKILGFYRPEYPDKEHLHFCNSHYEEWREIRDDFGYMDKWDFFSMFKKEIKECPNCSYTKDKDYYSLFYLEIKDSRVPDFTFKFHTPYPIGKDFFPAKNSLKKVTHLEKNEGLFQFGRSLFDEEKVVYREKDVLKYFEEAIEKYKLYISLNPAPQY